MRWKRSHDDSEPPGLDRELTVLRRTGRPVVVRRQGRPVAALITLDDLREHLGSTPDLSVRDDAAEEPRPEPAPRPASEPPPPPAWAGKLEALRELRELAVESD